MAAGVWWAEDLPVQVFAGGHGQGAHAADRGEDWAREGAAGGRGRFCRALAPGHWGQELARGGEGSRG